PVPRRDGDVDGSVRLRCVLDLVVDDSLVLPRHLEVGIAEGDRLATGLILEPVDPEGLAPLIPLERRQVVVDVLGYRGGRGPLLWFRCLLECFLSSGL